MSDNVLEVKHLRVEFPTRKGLLVAVDDVSFEIAQGEILGLVGESGAGKSLTGAPSLDYWSLRDTSQAVKCSWPATASTISKPLKWRMSEDG